MSFIDVLYRRDFVLHEDSCTVQANHFLELAEMAPSSMRRRGIRSPCRFKRGGSNGMLSSHLAEAVVG